MERVILHVDLNNFFASVEIKLNPHLASVPLAVAGDPKLRHGIVLAKNEIAKKAGVKTGDTIWQAKQKIKGLVITPPRRQECMFYSNAARKIYESFTDMVEPFGVDECWLDVTGSAKLFGSGYEIAQKISSRLKSELGLTASIGVSFNKIFAKIGSDYKKPDAITVISKQNFKQIVYPLPAGDLLMVGKKTATKLAKYGITTIGGIAESSPAFLKKLFGKNGETLFKNASGLDDSPVEKTFVKNLPKSVGNSTTTKRDLVTMQDITLVFTLLAENVAKRLRTKGLKGNVVSIGVRGSELTWSGFQHKINTHTFLASEIAHAALNIFKENCKPPFCIHSLALSVSGLTGEGSETLQQTFFEDSKAKKTERVEKSLDFIRRRFGENSIKIGTLRLDDDLIGEIHLGSFLEDKGTLSD